MYSIDKFQQQVSDQCIPFVIISHVHLISDSNSYGVTIALCQYRDRILGECVIL